MTLYNTYRENQFETVPELFDVIEDLEVARLSPVWTDPRQGDSDDAHVRRGDLVKVPDRQAVLTGTVEEETLQTHAVVSNHYTLIQHREALQPIAEALRDQDLGFTGQIYYPKRNNLGHVRARFQLTDDRYALVSDHFNIGLCVFVDNSFDKSGALSFHVGGFDSFCTNGQMWGDILHSQSVKHVGDSPAKALRQFEEFIDNLDEELDELAQLLGVAINTDLGVEEVNPFLRAVDIPQTYTEKILTGMVDGTLLVDQQLDTKWTVKGAFDAATNFFTHQYDRSIAGAERHLENAGKLVSRAEDKDQLVAEGKQIIRAEAE